MFKVYHGEANSWNAQDIPAALKVLEMALKLGYTNLLIVRESAEVSVGTDYSDNRDGRLGTIKMEIPIEV